MSEKELRGSKDRQKWKKLNEKIIEKCFLYTQTVDRMRIFASFVLFLCFFFSFVFSTVNCLVRYCVRVATDLRNITVWPTPFTLRRHRIQKKHSQRHIHSHTYTRKQPAEEQNSRTSNRSMGNARWENEKWTKHEHVIFSMFANVIVFRLGRHTYLCIDYECVRTRVSKVTEWMLSWKEKNRSRK